MDAGWWKLRLLWRWPQSPKKKIRRFVELGDRYRSQGKDTLARFCYERSWQLAEHTKAVHLAKKLRQRI